MDESPAYLLHKLVLEMDRAADKLLRTHLGISYKRALFLFVLQQHGTITQHALAVALGYSDPAVSTMLLELAKDGYIKTTPSPEHGRKRLVTITDRKFIKRMLEVSLIELQFQLPRRQVKDCTITA